MKWPFTAEWRINTGKQKTPKMLPNSSRSTQTGINTSPDKRQDIFENVAFMKKISCILINCL